MSLLAHDSYRWRKRHGAKACEHTHDASPRSSTDPTGTGALRGRFRNDLDRRWARLRTLVTEAVSQSDVLGLGSGPTVGSIAHASRQLHHAPLPGVDKVRGFQQWLDEALRQVVLGNDGRWTGIYIDQSADMALKRAQVIVGREALASDSRLQVLRSVTIAELQGIMEAVSQQSMRALAQGIMLRQRPAKIARAICERINAIGRVRGRAMVHYVIVKTHASATLDAYRAMGISKVGTIPENKPVIRQTKHGKILAKDAGPGSRSSRERTPGASTIGRIERAEARLQELGTVEVLTSGLDNVCETCQDISDNGPYDIDEAESLIPAHNFCSCSFTPADDARFASVHEED